MPDTFSPLASRTLDYELKDVYQTFFLKNDLVATGHYSIPLNPILPPDAPGENLVAREKISIKCFVGLAFAGWPGTVTLGDAELFTFESNGFERIGLFFLLDNPKGFIEYIQTRFADLLKKTGLTISVLAEAPRGYSLGFSGTFSGIIAYELEYLASKKDQPRSFGYLSDERDRVAGTAREIEAILRAPETEGQTSFQTLYSEAAPSVFIYKHGKERQLRKLVAIEKNLSDSLEYGVIYSGIAMRSSFVDPTAGQTEAKAGAEWCSSRLGIRLRDKNYTDSLKKILRLETAHFLSLLDTLFDAQNDGIENFLAYANDLAVSFQKLDGKSAFLQHAWKIIKEQTDLSETDITILPLYTTTKWGSYVWYGRRGVARKNLYRILPELKKRYPELGLIYDGSRPKKAFRPEVTIEQHRSAGYLSESYKVDGYILKSSGTSRMVEGCDMKHLSKGWLLVDQIARKIYIDGDRVSSKEILSQQTTIDLLEKFVETGLKEVHSKELPTSSYAQNKSEMMSKIIYPLMKTVHRRLGKEIKITCSGSVVDFVVRIDSPDFDLFCLEKAGKR